MNDDIKEILQALKESYDETMPKQEFERSLKYIEEYITNLEQENENNIKMLNDIIKEQDMRLNDLQQERIEYLERSNNRREDTIMGLRNDLGEAEDSITWWNNRYNALQRDYEELKRENERLKEQLFKSVNNTNNSMELTEHYKSCCEKAIEYINNNPLYSEDYDYDEEDNLVLQGVSCDEQSEDLLNILNGRSDK